MSGHPASGRRGAGLLPALCFGTLLVTGVAAALPMRPDPVGAVWALVFLAFLASQPGAIRRGTWLLLGAFLAAGLAGTSLTQSDLSHALERAGPIAALLAGLALLGRTAGRSPDIAQAASLLANRSPRARYLTLTLGTHLFSVFLNFGAVLLMATTLSRLRGRLSEPAVASGTLAILRGFAAMPLWSPLAISVIVTVSILPDLDYFAVMPIGLALAAAYMAAGFLLDGGGAAATARAAPASPRDVRALARVALRVAALVAGSLILLAGARLDMAASVLLAALGLAVPWAAAQALTGVAPLDVAGDLAGAGRTMINEIAVVAGAAFTGAVIVGMAGGGLAGAALGPSEAAAIAGVLPAAMVAAGALAVNPIISASVALGVLGVVWPEASLHWLAISVITGWGIAASGTPFTATVLIAGRIMERPAAVLAFRENGRLTIGATAAAGAVAAAGTFASS